MTQVATPALDAPALVTRLRATYDAGTTRPLAWRRAQLEALGRMVVEAEDELVADLVSDLGRAPTEAWSADLRVVGREVEDLLAHLETYLRPQRTKVPAVLRPGRAEVVLEPVGVVLVIAPWNYPVQLLLSPMAAALAAGNAVVAKPSEVAPACSAALARLLPRYLDPTAVAVVEGGVPETTALLEQRWDHVFYTGNGTVGRVVAAAAAKHLTPVTLELGGKSPVIVAEDANLPQAASRVAFAKFLNAGQTCLAADHVYVHRSVEREFLDLVQREITKRYGRDPRQSPDFARIVNSRHAERLAGLLDAGGFETVVGGERDPGERYVAPTVLRDVAPDAAVMQEEIFGPVLPVIAFDDLAEPLAAIRAGDHPLAVYVFTRSDATADRVVAETASGAVCVNDAVSHILVSGLPFGGVGGSGYGAYHGRWGVETFSHHRAVWRRPAWLPDTALVNPPYARWKERVLRRVL